MPAGAGIAAAKENISRAFEQARRTDSELLAFHRSVEDKLRRERIEVFEDKPKSFEKQASAHIREAINAVNRMPPSIRRKPVHVHVVRSFHTGSNESLFAECLRALGFEDEPKTEPGIEKPTFWNRRIF